jgi:hypothetical protein
LECIESRKKKLKDDVLGTTGGILLDSAERAQRDTDADEAARAAACESRSPDFDDQGVCEAAGSRTPDTARNFFDALEVEAVKALTKGAKDALFDAVKSLFE